MSVVRKGVWLPCANGKLTEAERQVAALAAHGLTNQQIADRLVISERTVRCHMSTILLKLHLTNRTQVALYALKTGIIELEDVTL